MFLDMFERFNVDARRVLVLAQEEARSRAADEITTAHILLALVTDGAGQSHSLLSEAGVSRADVAFLLPSPVDRPTSGAVPFSKATKKLLELSLREALQLGSKYIGSGHQLLALMRCDDVLTAWLAGHGVDRMQAVAAVARAPISVSEPNKARTRRLPRSAARLFGGPGRADADEEAGQDPAGDGSGETLLALAAEEGSAAQMALAALGIDHDSLAEAIRKVAAESAAADGPVVLEMGDGVSLSVEAGELARTMRGHLSALVEHGVVTGRLVDDGSFHAEMPGLQEPVTLSALAWLEAAAETLG